METACAPTEGIKQFFLGLDIGSVSLSYVLMDESRRARAKHREAESVETVEKDIGTPIVSIVYDGTTAKRNEVLAPYVHYILQFAPRRGRQSVLD